MAQYLFSDPSKTSLTDVGRDAPMRGIRDPVVSNQLYIYNSE